MERKIEAEREREGNKQYESIEILVIFVHFKQLLIWYFEYQG